MGGQLQNLNVAMFIDADNAPSRKIGDVLAELASFGSVSIRRAYGNWKNASLEPWGKVLHEHAIQPMQQFDLVKGKNATDMAMAVDAMDVLFNKPVDVFCLVSSDCDFTPLVMRLRAEGKQVVGFGERKAPEPFVNACSRFLYFDQPALTDDQSTALITHLCWTRLSRQSRFSPQPQEVHLVLLITPRRQAGLALCQSPLKRRSWHHTAQQILTSLFARATADLVVADAFSRLQGPALQLGQALRRSRLAALGSQQCGAGAVDQQGAHVGGPMQAPSRPITTT